MRFLGQDNNKHFIEPKRLNELGGKSDIRQARSQTTVNYQASRISRNIASDRQRLRVVKRNKVKAVLQLLGL